MPERTATVHAQTARKRPAKKYVHGYDDPDYDYRRYWQDRNYEHVAEELAIRRLLRAHHYQRALDIGGGYGRLSPLLSQFADAVILGEPSQKQLALAKEYLAEHPKIQRQLMQADDLQCADSSIDLILMLRVLSHVSSPDAEFAEIARVLSDDGVAIIEVANHGHILNRLKYGLRGQRIPTKAVMLGAEHDSDKPPIQLVAHNPQTISRQLTHAGLRVERVLSVSNLRQTWVKQTVPLAALLHAERWLQQPLAHLYFGPSIFFLVKKT